MPKSPGAKKLRKNPAPKKGEGFENALSKFAEWMGTEGYADRTIRCYLFDVGHFARWLSAARGIESFAFLSPDLVRDHQSALAARPGKEGRPLTPRTRAHVLCAILALGKFLAKTGRAGRNPTDGIALPRIPRKLPDNVLSVREVERILSAPRLDSPVELRNRALMELLYATGLRQKESLDLRLEDVDLSTGEVRVQEGKGGKSRIVPLGREAAAVLGAYLAEARPHLAGGGDSGHFFLSRRGKRVDPSRMLKTFKRYASRAGIARPVGFHTFRHSVATHLLQRGAGIRYIQELLGHDSLTSTQIYTHVSITDLKAAHAKYHPRERMEV